MSQNYSGGCVITGFFCTQERPRFVVWNYQRKHIFWPKGFLCHCSSRRSSPRNKVVRRQFKIVSRCGASVRDWETITLWAWITKNTDWSTGPLARPFANSLVSLTRSLTPDCSLRSRPPLRSLVRSLTLLTPSLVGQWINRWLFILCFFLFWPIVH